MHSALIARAAGAIVASVILSISAIAAETSVEPPSSSGCDQAPATPVIDLASSRLPELTYECMRLGRDQHVLIGRGGLREGQSVLLVHGLGNNAHLDWRNTVPALAARFRVLTLDLPGFGASEPLRGGYSFEHLAALLAELLDREQIHRVHVVGHSLGGALSLYFAHAYPQRTQRLVLVDAAGMLLKSVYVHHVSRISTPELGFAPVDRVLRVFDNRVNGLNRHITYRLESRFDFSAWLADHPAARNALLGRFTQTDAALGLIEHDFTRAIRETKAPTTVIWGRNDDVSPVRVGQLLTGRLPDARLHILERTGHVPMTQAREEFNTLLLAALADTLQLPQKMMTSGVPIDVRCHEEAERRYAGALRNVVLENCRDIRIENARIEKLTLINSSVFLDNVSIVGGDAVLEAKNSFVTGTVVSVIAEGIAVSLDDSQLDLAGTSIRAGARAVRMVTPGRIYFSVSDIQAADFSGDVHKIWSE
jgi:pimeloyl-ACP methyl ester carboxylesterase